MKRYPFICWMIISTLGWLPTLGATSILIYLIINKTNTRIKIPSHDLTLEKKTVSFLENKGPLERLEMKKENNPIELNFEPPLVNDCWIELYEVDEDDKQLDVFIVGPDQPWNE